MTARPASPAISNLTLTNADTEYSVQLPDNLVAFRFRARGGAAIRWAYETGKVATPTAPYMTLPENGVFNSPENVCPIGQATSGRLTVYFGTDTAGEVVEIETWDF